MNNYDTILKSMLAQALKHEARLSDRQIALLRWQQLADHKLRTNLGREVKLTDATWNALQSLPVGGGFVFSTTSLPPSGLPKTPMKDKVREKIERWKNKPRKHLVISFQ